MGARLRVAASLLPLALLAACRSAPSEPPSSPRRLDPPAQLTAWDKLTWLKEQLKRGDPADSGERALLLLRCAELYVAVDRPSEASSAARQALYETEEHSELKGAVTSRAKTVLGAVALLRGDGAAATRDLQEAAKLGRDETDRSAAFALLAVAAERGGNASEAAGYRARVKLPGDPRVTDLMQPFAQGPVRTAKSPSPSGPATPVAAMAGPPVIPRARWSPSPIGSNVDPMGPLTCITVHHEAQEFNGKTLDDSLRQVQRIQKFHKTGRGYADIGYHYMIDRLGNVIECRPLTIQGAHAGEKNRFGQVPNAGNIGISLLGNYEVQTPTPDQVRALKQLIASLQSTYGLPKSAVYTHAEIRAKYDLAGTACPGCNLKPIVLDIRARGPLASSAGPSEIVPARRQR